MQARVARIANLYSLSVNITKSTRWRNEYFLFVLEKYGDMINAIHRVNN